MSRTLQDISQTIGQPRAAPSKVLDVEAIVIEGGGVRGIACGPPLRRVFAELPGGFDQVRLMVGSSAGFLNCLAAALTVGDVDRIDEIIRAAPFDRFARWNLLTSPGRLLFGGGFASLSPAREWIRDLLVHYTGSADVTFGELSEMRDGMLVAAVTSDVATWRPRVFSAASDPEEPVWRAALASMCIPGVWPAVGRLVDGGALMNLPLGVALEGHPARVSTRGAAYLPTFRADQILALRLDTDWETAGTAPPWPTSWLARVFKGPVIISRTLAMLVDKAGRGHVPSGLWPRVIRIDTGSVRATDFELTERKVRELRADGLKAYEKWLSK